MTNPMRTCTAIIGLAESFQAHFPTYQATEALLTPALLNAASTQPGGRSSDHSDPTARYATGLTFTLKAAPDAKCSSYHDTEHALGQALAWMRLAQARQNYVIRQDAQIARDADATRATLTCDGTFDALCHRGVWKAGKCRECYNADAKRRERARDRTGTGASTFDVLEDVASDARPVEPMAPMRPVAEVWCHRCATTYTVIARPEQWLEQHRHYCDGTPITLDVQ